MAEPIKMLFGIPSGVGPMNHVLDEDPDPDCTVQRGNSEGEGWLVVKYRDSALSCRSKEACGR